ncbi:hypothetical protein KCU71_g30, partial [Aureobasidium melanogenum]
LVVGNITKAGRYGGARWGSCMPRVVVILQVASAITIFDQKKKRYHCISFAYSNIFQRLLIIVDIDLGVLPVTRVNLALEQNIDLTVRSALHLRNAEVCGDETDEASTAPDVATLATDYRKS